MRAPHDGRRRGRTGRPRPSLTRPRPRLRASVARGDGATVGVALRRVHGGVGPGDEGRAGGVGFVGNGAGLTNVAGTFGWQTVSGTAQQAAANMGYVASGPAPVTITR